MRSCLFIPRREVDRGALPNVSTGEDRLRDSASESPHTDPSRWWLQSFAGTLRLRAIKATIAKRPNSRFSSTAVDLPQQKGVDAHDHPIRAGKEGRQKQRRRLRRL